MKKHMRSFEHNYPSDLTDKQWQALLPLLNIDPDEPARTYAVRDMVDAIFYFNRSGCAWRYLPQNLPPWQNIQYYFYKWTRDGTWERINASLRELVRVAAGRKLRPTAGSIDAQSVKTTEKRGTPETPATTLARKLKVVNDTYLLIRSVSS